METWHSNKMNNEAEAEQKYGKESFRVSVLVYRADLKPESSELESWSCKYEETFTNISYSSFLKYGIK